MSVRPAEVAPNGAEAPLMATSTACYPLDELNFYFFVALSGYPWLSGALDIKRRWLGRGVPEGGLHVRDSLFPRALRRSGLMGAMALLLTTFVPAAPASAFGSSAPPPGPPSVNAGGYMTCGVRADGLAACWGENGLSGNEGPGQSTPPAGVTFKEVNSGYSHACGVKTDDTLACWGANPYGGATPPAGTFSHVAAGYLFSCGLRTDGTASCWGRDDAGQVSGTPVGETFSQLTVGIRHVCGLRADGTVSCWGSNAYGQQSEIPADTALSQINSGNFDICGLRSSDGTAVCWGRNTGVQDVEPEGAFTQITAGFTHVCGLRADQTITCWGGNNQSQATPPAGTFKNVSAGTFHSCAMTTEDSVACWGNNAAGRVAPTMTSDPVVPGAVVGQPYSHQFTSTYFSPHSGWSITAGTLPPGLTLSPDGLLSGTPTKAGTWSGITASAGNGLSAPASETFGMVVLGEDDGIDNCAVNSGGDCLVDRGTTGGEALGGYAVALVEDMRATVEANSPCRLVLGPLCVLPV